VSANKDGVGVLMNAAKSEKLLKIVLIKGLQGVSDELKL
jgi:hypothetical protein